MKKAKPLIFSLAAIFLMSSMLFAADDAALKQLRSKLPVPGEVLINIDASALMPGVADPAFGDIKIIEKAAHVTVLKPSKNAWDVQLISPTTKQAVHRGDVIFFAVEARCVQSDQDTGEGEINGNLQLAHAPWTPSTYFETAVGRDWQTIYASGVSFDNFAAGDLELALHMARISQTLEIGNVIVLNLGPNVDFRKLPFTPITYLGREKDAPWRKKAAEQIEKYRKGDLTVNVQNQSGQPISGVSIDVEMTRHAYSFGSFLEDPVLEQSPNGERYRSWFLKMFNKATTPLYWADWGWANPQGRERFLKMATWLHDHHIATRGHNLVWPSFRNTPTALKQLEKKPDELRTTIHDHVREVTEAMKPFDLAEMDVINEPRAEHEFMDILGNEVMVDWFKTAHEADPRIKLFVNDYSILTNGGRTEYEQETYEKTIQYLIDHGAPLGGIGMQGHFGSDLTPPEKVWKILDRFQKLGKDIEVTEFTIGTVDEAAQGDYERDFLTAMFAHPATIGVVHWGFWEGQIYEPLAALIRKDWTLKPNGKAYMDLVFNQWWTRAKGTTDNAGQYKIRGFLGDYQITVEHGGQHKTVSAKLVREGSQILVNLDE
ncbi:MAG TPA: endo-1,4-beta-xylanase [Tepidisphaeraceae bacterium]|nr:endo-1,4-beta-xylanase [Tepidisphaeraceae bacterium]